MTNASSRVRFDAPDTDPAVPVAEIETTTRYQEARVAMTVVASLRERDIPIRDIAVVARNLDAYEEPLSRAAIRHGIAPVFWTQIRLTDTHLYQLIIAICELFAAAEPTHDEFFRPLELEWTPEAATAEWPIPAAVLVETYNEAPTDGRSIDAWQTLLQDADWADERVVTFAEWVATDPEPTPTAVEEYLGGVVDAYRETVLPVRRESDTPALMETETAARAVVRMQTLVEQVESKYAQRLADHWTDDSWTAIAGICESLAEQRPGRREHANARALDILEANDVWGRDIPYVVAIGLADGEWPHRGTSTIPPEIQHAILAGEDDVARLSPQTAWLSGRDLDQFRDTVDVASEGLIVTRYTRDVDGRERSRSPLLDRIDDVDVVDDHACRQLLSTDRVLPAEIESMLPGSSAAASKETSNA